MGQLEANFETSFSLYYRLNGWNQALSSYGSQLNSTLVQPHRDWPRQHRGGGQLLVQTDRGELTGVTLAAPVRFELGHEVDDVVKLFAGFEEVLEEEAEAVV
jgi:hypothetical protein